ncbi:MAG: general secretion pathway protein GspN [Hyphomicrobiales bacterium]|nr:general secretion pathway protein GspN [Hyphomicrobiales bacterium]
MTRLSLALAVLLAAPLAAPFASWAGDGALLAPAALQAEADGNPLWALPLEKLSATRDRPLFSASRRPPPPVVASAPPRPAPVAAKPAAPATPPFKLLGAIVGVEARIALLKDRATGAVLRVHEGDEQSGWRALSVAARSIVLGRGGDTATLQLPRPGEAPDASPQTAAVDDLAVAAAATPAPSVSVAIVADGTPSDPPQPSRPPILPREPY